MATLTAATIGVEILDDPGADPALVRRMLTDIARANRWLGGVAALNGGLSQLLGSAERGRSFTLLDVGTGAGDLPLAAEAWGARRGIEIRGVGVERHPAAAQLARANGVPAVIACGSMLPFRNMATGDARQATTPGSTADGRPSPVTRRNANIDIVLISQLLHHFDDDAAITVIREAARVARHGVILTDLRPSVTAAVGFRLAGLALRFHRDTIGDGVISMSRGRSAAALANLTRRAGVSQATARDLPLARVVVTWRSNS